MNQTSRTPFKMSKKVLYYIKFSKNLLPFYYYMSIQRSTYDRKLVKTGSVTTRSLVNKKNA